MSIREKIIEQLHETLAVTESRLSRELTDEMVLLDCGLDSLGFAILVARLEQELDSDPFSDAEEAFYPRTFGEFVGVYESASGESAR